MLRCLPLKKKKRFSKAVHLPTIIRIVKHQIIPLLLGRDPSSIPGTGGTGRGNYLHLGRLEMLTKRGEAWVRSEDINGSREVNGDGQGDGQPTKDQLE